ncbi:Hypothetical protein I596_1983 [Dokdonella koreensis DS-123]|uniref:Uncharacterized protein n=1 Tax=Dokdonella koreensis DS-123 TaxID=1300342 RepID=A0A160DUQ4_9GAMM|nr:Hypothetical protein I596_1983 [Dokdonella koreensis DS-123]
MRWPARVPALIEPPMPAMIPDCRARRGGFQSRHPGAI